MKLVNPSLKYKKEYLEALEESSCETGETRLNMPEPEQTFEEFVKMWDDQSKGVNPYKGMVPATMYWLIDNEEVIGRVHVRHSLNEYLLNFGGHIGYYIKPSKRKMGYGTKILKLALAKAKQIGLKEVLLTCDEGNVGSQKIIECCGGVLENIVEEGGGKRRKRRYWIEL